MNIDPEWKMIRPGRIEKWVLRNAFDNDQKPYLPKHILYRQKEQFSDGVGYSWIDGLKDHANSQDKAAVTFVLRNCDGHGVRAGVLTFMGLKEGLKFAWYKGFQWVVVEGDSKIFIEAMKGSWEVP
ncbi:hypothetical protein ACFX13_019457 [Malus domestica]